MPERALCQVPAVLAQHGEGAARENLAPLVEVERSGPARSSSSSRAATCQPSTGTPRSRARWTIGARPCSGTVSSSLSASSRDWIGSSCRAPRARISAVARALRGRVQDDLEREREVPVLRPAR